MDYYNPYRIELKDERLELLGETKIGDTDYLNYYLHPQDSYICPNCYSNNTILFGTKTRKLNIQIHRHYKSNVVIKLHRIQCKQCYHLFYDQIKDANKDETIANSTKLQILLDLKHDLSFTYIAKTNNVSIDTVIRIFTENIRIEREKLPEVLCLDEFKNLKSSYGKYAFLLYSPNQSEIIDILPDRRLDRIKDYFYKIDFHERDNVKYIITDMYEPYRQLIHYCFPKATHIIDSFHYVRYVIGAFNDVRIRIQSNYNTSTKEYKILKNSRNLLIKNIQDLTSEELYNCIQSKKTTQSEIITDCLLISNELSEAYSILQDFLISWRNVKYENANEWYDSWIHTLLNSNVKEFQELHKTFNNWRKEILNSFIRFGDNRLNNGYIEGMNNRIKEIKRVGFGYRNFNHFRMRLMYIINEKLSLNKLEIERIK